MIKFSAPSQEEAARQLVSTLPDGRVWHAKTAAGTNMHALVSACAAEFRQIQIQIETLAREFDVNLTDQLLPDWETSVGLPEECTGQLAALADRRKAVILRLRKIPFVTKADYEQLAFDLTGLSVTVTPGAELELFPLDFPIILASGNSYFKLYVTFNDAIGGFPYLFPFNFISTGDNIIRCVFEQIAPANVLIIFQ
jgi:uncharacterized protein YmfQ (DUF2313 family)